MTRQTPHPDRKLICAAVEAVQCLAGYHYGFLCEPDGDFAHAGAGGKLGGDLMDRARASIESLARMPAKSRDALFAKIGCASYVLKQTKHTGGSLEDYELDLLKSTFGDLLAVMKREVIDADNVFVLKTVESVRSAS